ncbi:MAG: PaaI family thioesterase [Candidatus Cloacimonadales bacterium]|nr:PaaI family thioesterase [Candidatus Cloacimonadales bacterium]
MQKYSSVLLQLKGEPGWKEFNLPATYGDGRSFVMGDNSGKRLTVRYFVRESDNRFFAKIFFGSATQGPPGYAHGGSIAAVLDEAMGFAAWITGQTVVAAKLCVDYKKMLPLKTIATIEAWIDSIKGRKVITKSKIYDENGTTFSKAEGLYINIPKERFRDILNYRDKFKT